MLCFVSSNNWYDMCWIIYLWSSQFFYDHENKATLFMFCNKSTLFDDNFLLSFCGDCKKQNQFWKPLYYMFCSKIFFFFFLAQSWILSLTLSSVVFLRMSGYYVREAGFILRVFSVRLTFRGSCLLRLRCSCKWTSPGKRSWGRSTACQMPSVQPHKQVWLDEAQEICIKHRQPGWNEHIYI